MAARVVRRVDFATRVKAGARALRARFDRRDTLLDVVRRANASRDPAKVASWLVSQLNEWIPAPCWAVVAPDVNGQRSVIAQSGLTPELGPSLWTVVNCVMERKLDYSVADLAREVGALPGAYGSAMAFPLVSRGELIGAAIGLDVSPSGTAPTLSGATLLLLQSLLEAPAFALDNALALQRAEALSVTDDLTRLYNARFLNLVLRREAKRASRNGRPLSLLFIDLDGFKDVNDRHGHLAGSKALVEVGGIIKGSARETDIAARFGGDEFALVLPDTSAQGAWNVAERIRDRFRLHRFLSADGLFISLTASIGAATLPDSAASAEELLRVADAAMYRVKARGKNGIQVAQE